MIAHLLKHVKSLFGSELRIWPTTALRADTTRQRRENQNDRAKEKGIARH